MWEVQVSIPVRKRTLAYRNQLNFKWNPPVATNAVWVDPDLTLNSSVNRHTQNREGSWVGCVPQPSCLRFPGHPSPVSHHPIVGSPSTKLSHFLLHVSQLPLAIRVNEQFGGEGAVALFFSFVSVQNKINKIK